ncbi:MAG: hypothetical protein ABIL09_24075 [Gemmatimonadota bacterium]
MTAPISLQNSALALTLAADGGEVRLVDRRRDVLWLRQAPRAGYRLYPEGDRAAAHSSYGSRAPLVPFGAGRAEAAGDAVLVRYPAPGGEVVYRWSLGPDWVEVAVEAAPDGVEFVSLPGPFAPAEGAHRLAVPLYQGLLLRRFPEDLDRTFHPGGHLSMSLGMGGDLGERGGLLTVQETLANWQAWVGAAAGHPWFGLEARHCPVEGWGEGHGGRRVRLYLTEADVTALCKRYRARLKERGDFVSWEEKRRRKPAVADLFGALMAFVGYNRADDVDYVAGARALRDRGFPRVFYYPVRMCHYSLGFRMGGDPPIWLDHQTLARLKEVDGACLGPWGWVYEGLDTGDEATRALFRRDARGAWIPHWRIDDQQWYRVCTTCQVDYVRDRLAGDMAAMDWIHFDVNACVPGMPCFERGHAGHAGSDLGRRGDLEWTRRLFSPDTVGQRLVSSEGFVAHYAGHYDIGATKMVPAADLAAAPAVPVPMTLLVFHDSCVHDWWELHNYNAVDGFPLADLPHGWGRAGSGEPRLKACLDALYGCPPNVFPFGRQYGWIDLATRQTYSFTVRLEDPAVQEALDAALAVARLHRRTGPCELIDFRLLSGDGAVQATTFGDGTRVVANLSTAPQTLEDGRILGPHAWAADGS